MSGSYRTAYDRVLPNALQVADPFHVIRLANQRLDEVRRRVQNETLGHRGRKADPLYRIRRLLTSASERISDRGRTRLRGLLDAGDPHGEVRTAWHAKETCEASTRSTAPPSRSDTPSSSPTTSETSPAARGQQTGVAPSPLVFPDHNWTLEGDQRTTEASKPDQTHQTASIRFRHVATYRIRASCMRETQLGPSRGPPPLNPKSRFGGVCVSGCSVVAGVWGCVAVVTGVLAATVGSERID